MPRPPNQVTVQWAGARRFRSGRPGGPRAEIDGDSAAAPSPVETLLGALGACSAVDVVDILTKRRTPPERLEVAITGHRVETTPRRLTRVTMEFRVDGASVERAQAERAVDLAVNRYCSVRDSLARDIAIELVLVLNGESAPVRGEASAAPAGASPGGD